MSRNGSVDLELGDETYRFRLGIGDLESLQEETDVGAPEHLYRLFSSTDHTFRHTREIVRAGLIGGGMAVTEASRIARGLDDMPTVRVIATATLIMAAALEGAEDERLPASKGKDVPPMDNGKMPFLAFYASAAAMKLSVADVRSMSLWQFSAYLDGHNRANDPNAVDPLSANEEDALWNWISATPEGEASAPE
ncbi:hypothetical protein ASG40_11660 [Methylobacterium sp. Leaf399]|uniref:gene transfer agent family protein n=1 Tax=Methylobacterium sp. Leaf399 TaxID=1736364 RepID=UPI0006F472E3|nr:gene transfer agent family protein [Methylobacterium sp. Leaf399]KQT08528.1 hypothetical protein ASG40_11660 [Methylobacterium sp. Leaf399]